MGTSPVCCILRQIAKKEGRMRKMNIGSVMLEFGSAGITDLNVAEIISVNGKPDVRLYATETPSKEYTDAILGVARKIVMDAASEVMAFRVKDSGQVHLSGKPISPKPGQIPKWNTSNK